MATLTFTREPVSVPFNRAGEAPRTADGRRVIYGGAFGQAIRSGRMSVADFTAYTDRMCRRPQLYAINGRPC